MSDNFNFVQLDNGRFNYSSNLQIFDNIFLIFLPPYSPELNLIERVWQHIRQKLSLKIYENLDEIKAKVRAFLEDFSLLTIASITGNDPSLRDFNSLMRAKQTQHTP
ncbi:transposase [Microcoleus sp. A003_D6]|uniref:transposase n=1 Tax=Microcoleus sp. A003_D6 TaxID=3055266 RepID=UPI003FA5EB2E